MAFFQSLDLSCSFKYRSWAWFCCIIVPWVFDIVTSLQHYDSVWEKCEPLSHLLWSHIVTDLLHSPSGDQSGCNFSLLSHDKSCTWYHSLTLYSLCGKFFLALAHVRICKLLNDDFINDLQEMSDCLSDQIKPMKLNHVLINDFQLI